MAKFNVKVVDKFIMSKFKLKFLNKKPDNFYTRLCGIEFKEINLNPKEHITGDCVVQAISSATGKDYMDVLKRLHTISEENCFIFNSENVIDIYLEELGYHKISLDITNNTSIAEFIYHNKDNEYLISSKKHIIYVNNGIAHDTKYNIKHSDMIMLERTCIIYTKDLMSLHIDAVNGDYELKEIPHDKVLNSPAMLY